MNLAVGSLAGIPGRDDAQSVACGWTTSGSPAEPGRGPALSASPLSIKAGRAGTNSLDDLGLGLGPRLPLVLRRAEAFFLCAQPSVVDSATGKQSATLTVSTKSGFGPNAQVTVPGSYAVAVSAVTVSGDTATLSVPLRVN
jgi:hypothetical protein